MMVVATPNGKSNAKSQKLTQKANKKQTLKPSGMCQIIVKQETVISIAQFVLHNLVS